MSAGQLTLDAFHLKSGSVYFYTVVVSLKSSSSVFRNGSCLECYNTFVIQVLGCCASSTFSE